MGTLALIGLGSNLGDRKGILDAAVASLAKTPGVEVRAVSSYHETAPVGGPAGQGRFLNAVAVVESLLSQEALHDRMCAVENAAGRQRIVRWGDRTLDLDLLLFGGTIQESGTLQIPHPSLAVRRFVLAPAAEVAPDFLDPGSGLTIAQLLEKLDRRPRYLALIGFAWPHLSRLAEALGGVGVSAREPIVWAGKAGPIDTTNQTEMLFRQTLDRQATCIRRDRWQDLATPDGCWIVSDFWLDALLALALGRSTPPNWVESFHRDFVEARSSCLRPTFVACFGSLGWNRWEALQSAASRCPDLGGVPVFRRSIGSDTDAAVSEILAACAAVESGTIVA